MVHRGRPQWQPRVERMLLREHIGGKMRHSSPSGKEVGSRKPVQRIKHRAKGMHRAVAGGDERKSEAKCGLRVGTGRHSFTWPLLRDWRARRHRFGGSAASHLRKSENVSSGESSAASTGLFPEPPESCPLPCSYNMIDGDTTVTRLALGAGQPVLTTS